MQVSYPGVYVTEVRSTVRPIAPVSTSVAAFVGQFARGTLDKAVQVFGMADFERAFGGVTAHSAASYQVAQFFQNGGSTAILVRIAKNSLLAHYDKSLTAGNALRAPSEGAWGNQLRVVVTPGTSSVNKDSVTVNVTLYENASLTRSPVEAREAFPDLVPAQELSKILEASRLIVVVVGAGGAPTVGDLPLNGRVSPKLTAPFPELTVQVGSATAVKIDLTGASKLDEALRLVRAAIARNSVLHGLVADVTQDERLVLRLTRASALFFEAGTFKLTKLEVTATGGTPVFEDNPSEYVFEGGDDGDPPSPAEILGVRSEKKGMFALENSDLFNLLLIPDALSQAAPAECEAIYQAALVYCEERRALLLVDLPIETTAVADAQTWLNDNAALQGSGQNAAAYFPAVVVADSARDFLPKRIPPSGTVAGIFARTDASRGVWKSPAGVEASARGIQDLEAKLTDLEHGALNPRGLNCLRSFPLYGPVVWGARTLQGADAAASEWKYVAIRRLALFIEESLFRGTKWVVFEPNDEPLWAKIRLNIGAFMLDLFRQGAFQGDTPSKAFFVKCDSETTTANDRNLGVVNIEVGFAPLKPAEFVVLKIQQIPDV